MDRRNFQVRLERGPVAEHKIHPSSQSHATSQRELIRSANHQAVRGGVIVSSLPNSPYLRLRLYKKFSDIKAFTYFPGPAQRRDAVISRGAASGRVTRAKIVPDP